MKLKHSCRLESTNLITMYGFGIRVFDIHPYYDKIITRLVDIFCDI